MTIIFLSKLTLISARMKERTRNGIRMQSTVLARIKYEYSTPYMQARAYPQDAIAITN